MLPHQYKILELTCSCGEKYICHDLGPFTKSLCDKCVEEFDKVEAERLASEVLLREQKEQRERVLRARIPDNWRNTFFDSSDPKIHPGAFSACQNYSTTFSRDSKSLIIYSDVLGSGKTHLAICIANHLLHQRHFEVRYIKAADILMEVKSTYNRTSKEDEEDVLSRLLNTRVLIIDDLGVNKATEWSDEMFWAIFDRRLENKLPVIVTTNYAPEDDALGIRIGNGALSRLLGMCGDNIVTFKGKDLRRNKK
jgi:DNA replication protein DnaC